MLEIFFALNFRHEKKLNVLKTYNKCFWNIKKISRNLIILKKLKFLKNCQESNCIFKN